jgi:hypothetical protein
MKNFVQWLKRVFHWVRSVPITGHYWGAVAVVAVTVAIVRACGWSEDAFRLAGMFLQLGGVFTVVLGILKTRAEFGQPSIRSQFKAWVQTFPLSLTQRLTVRGSASISVSSDGSIYQTHGPSADQTIEGRLGHLEDIVRKLEAAHGRTHIAVLQAEKKAQKALEEQARQLTSLFYEKIEKTATGGLHLSGVGAVLIFFGTVFGGAGPELHRLLTL